VTRLPPVYSPLSLGAIVESLAAAARGEAERASLEADLAETFSADRVILTGSGTQALQLALAGVRPTNSEGRVVAMPAYSCYDLVTAAVGAGVRVRFYDVDPVTLTPDVDSLRAVLHDGVSAVVAANLYGYPLDASALAEACASEGVPIIEDAAQGIGTRTSRGRGGTWGTASVLSFGRGKGWTGGGGGALLLRGDRADALSIAGTDEGRAAAAGRPSAKTAAVTFAAWLLGRPALYRIPTAVPGLGLGETRYRPPQPAGSISGFSAALVRRTAGPAIEAIEARREVADLYRQALHRSRARFDACDPAGGRRRATYLRFPVLAGDDARAARTAVLGRDLGVAPGYPLALPDLPEAGSLTLPSRTSLSGSRELAARLVTLPTHRWAGPAAVRRIASTLLLDRV